METATGTLSRHWFVELELHVNGYEKVVCQLVEAPSAEQAEAVALSCEAHNELVPDGPDGGFMDDGMMYRIYRVREVPEADMAVLSKYMPPMP